MGMLEFKKQGYFGKATTLDAISLALAVLALVTIYGWMFWDISQK